MALQVTITSTKGGVGRTTLTAHLGSLMADLGQRVLLVHADVQPTLSSYFPLNHRAQGGLSALIGEARTAAVISGTNVPSLDSSVSDDPEGTLQNGILHTPDGRVRLKHLLSHVDHDYDVILLDTQGAVGPLQDAAVLAADLLVSPIPPEILSVREFARGTVQMLGRRRSMIFLGAALGSLRELVYRIDRTVGARRIALELRRETYGPSKGAITLLDAVIPNAVAFRDAECPRHHAGPRPRVVPAPRGHTTLESTDTAEEATT